MKIPFFGKSKTKSFEGMSRAPFSGMSELGGWFGIDPKGDGWQKNLEVGANDAKRVPAVYASVMASARAISQCKPILTKYDSKDKKEVVKTGYLAELLRSPNSYETFNQFILNMVASMLFDGESFAYCVRDANGKITQMHRLNKGSCSPYLADGEIFYSIGQNPMVATEIEALIPMRDILHLRSHTPRHPMIGESAISAATLALGVNVALSHSQVAFFNQMSRPSGYITTDQPLTKVQLDSLRSAWEQQSTKMNQGGIPVLGGGMKFMQMGLSSQDAQIVEAQKYSTADIARVFGIPLPIIGELENATLSNVEQLISMWLSMSLGSLIENVEASLDKLFDLPANQHINLDESALLRMDFKTRIEGMSTATQGGIYTINEAREKMGLHPVDKGDTPYLQMQMQPIGWTEEQANKPDPEPVVAMPVETVIDEEVKSTNTSVELLLNEVQKLAENQNKLNAKLDKSEEQRQQKSKIPELSDEDKTIIYLDTLRKKFK